MTEEAKNQLDKIKEIEKMVDREKLVYKTNEYTYDFRNFQTITSFGREIYNGKITLKEADRYQGDLSVDVLNFGKQIKPKNPKRKQQKEDILKSLYNFYFYLI